MFVGDEVSLGVSFAAAQARLASLIRVGLLASASARAYNDGITGLAQASQEGVVPGPPGVVQVHSRYLQASGESVRLALRWEVTGPGGELVPVLDADITLAPAGERSATLALAGAYRQPVGTAGGALDRAVMHRVATATIRAFLHRIADVIAQPALAPGPQAGAAGTDPPRLRPDPGTP